MKIVFIFLLTLLLSFSLTVFVLAHCGSTWEVQSPTFGPTLGNTGCIADSNPTTTSKSVQTTIYWTVGTPLTVVVTDSGMNKLVGGFITNSCVRCFPVFEAPAWTDVGDGTTRWSQNTYYEYVGDDNTCLVGFARGPIIHHYERSCSSGGGGDDGGATECLGTGEVCSSSPDCCNGLFCTDGFCGDPEAGPGCPVLIDVLGNGFSVTNAVDGVNFDLKPDAVRERVSWTSSCQVLWKFI
jgi:hypothetical protein